MQQKLPESSRRLINERPTAVYVLIRWSRHEAMKILLALLAIVALALFCSADIHAKIVEENGICVDEIKSLEECLKAAGQGQGWCDIGTTVK